MYQLNYRSVSRSGLKLEDLEAILETAISENAARNITGCLIYHNQSFVQILEGSKKNVLSIYENIKNDDRHHTVTLLWENDVDHRTFEDWNMAFYKPNDNYTNQYVSNLLMLSELSDKSSGSLMTFWDTIRRIIRKDLTSEDYRI